MTGLVPRSSAAPLTARQLPSGGGNVSRVQRLRLGEYEQQTFVGEKMVEHGTQQCRIAGATAQIVRAKARQGEESRKPLRLCGKKSQRRQPYHLRIGIALPCFHTRIL